MNFKTKYHVHNKRILSTASKRRTTSATSKEMKEQALNISAIIGLSIILICYASLSFDLGLTKNEISIVYALSNHIGVMIIALVFLFMSKCKILSFVSAYTFLFFFISTTVFIYIGLMKDQSYFDYKLAMVLSIPLTFLYELISYFIRRSNKRY